MHQRRFDAVAVSLPDGRILVIGGVDGGSGALASAETYDPVSRTWSFAGSMSTGRWDHGAVVLPDGRVLVAGGRCCGDAPGAGQPQGQALGTAELFDPPTGTWTLTGSLSVPRQRATLTLLGNGLVLCAGGYDGQGNDYATAELYDPATGTWSPAASMNEERWGHTATLLPTGTVLAAGGIGTSGQTAELYLPDPSPTL